MNKRLKNLQKKLTEKKLAGLLIRVVESGQSTQPNNQNVLYLSGFGGSTAVLLVTPKDAFIVADARYYSRAKTEAKGFKLVKIKRGDKVSVVINEAISLAGITKKAKVGFESHRLPFQIAQSWMKELNASVVPTAGIVEGLRQYKTEAEIKELSAACKATCKVYSEVQKLIEPGMRETEVAYEIDTRLRKHGACDNSFSSIVAAGPNSAIPHHATGSKKLESGEPVVMDFGGVFPGGYCSDITRTIFVPGKKPTAKMKEIYEIVLGANLAARKALKPGMLYKDYDKVARDYIDKRGYGKYFTHGLGHSLGLEAHDPFDYENAPLDVGTVFTDEPGIYIDGVGGVRIEDDLVVTAGGAERLTTAPYWKF